MSDPKTCCARTASSGDRKTCGTIVDRVEGDAFLAQLEGFREREDLVAAGVGEQGAIPAVESVQAPRRLDHCKARTQVKVIGVGQYQVVAQLAHPRRQDRLTEPRVPTGMNAGVSTSPCAVWRMPQRASPHLSVTSNSFIGDIISKFVHVGLFRLCSLAMTEGFARNDKGLSQR